MIMNSENYIKKLIEEDLRIDKRAFDEFRKIDIKVNEITSAEGSARVRIGNTHILAGIKMAVGTPFPDTPAEGILIVNAEFAPIASPTFEPGPPSESSIEMARVIDRGIRESHCIDLDKLCIIEKEKVWIINVDIHVLDHDGNLIDAGGLAAIIALLNTQIPKYENEKIDYKQHSGKLPVVDIPVPITIYKIANKLLVDTNVEEENALDARITICTNKAGNICAMQKGGVGHLTTEELEKAVDLSIKKGNEIRSLIK
ncbi:MAG: exosome complex protein Rrp42 [Nanoarchaeota archaeon]|nr:exosome complex protein Rrp42 [Nanoarchaeota archaeon]MBU4124519.1 exosome complex protein Rrp42 [Nanoarchaeota archaeon]